LYSFANQSLSDFQKKLLQGTADYFFYIWKCGHFLHGIQADLCYLISDSTGPAPAPASRYLPFVREFPMGEYPLPQTSPSENSLFLQTKVYFERFHWTEKFRCTKNVPNSRKKAAKSLFLKAE
jgi:hypothetical protein